MIAHIGFNCKKNIWNRKHSAKDSNVEFFTRRQRVISHIVERVVKISLTTPKTYD